MDQKRLAQLGRHQTWLSPQTADGFVYTYSSEMIGSILLHIREACDKAKETHLPTEILVILYGLGNPAIGCHMDCTKDFLHPDAIITPTKILNELPPGRDVTLAMRMFSTLPGVRVYSLHEPQLDEHTRAYQDVHKTAGSDGTLIKQAFTEGDVLDYRNSKKEQEMLEENRHYELALWLREGPKDEDGTTVVEDRILQFMDPYPGETRLQRLVREASLATVVIFRLSMAFLTDNMVAKFKLKRPLDQTCLEWEIPLWLERRANLTRSNEWYELFQKEEEIETRAGLLWSRYTRFRLYLRAAHFETYLAEEEIRRPLESIEKVLADIERFFDLILEQVEESASACKTIFTNTKEEYGNEPLWQIAQDPNRYEGLKRMFQILHHMTCDQYPVVYPRE